MQTCTYDLHFLLIISNRLAVLYGLSKLFRPLALNFVKKQCYYHESSPQPISILVGKHDLCTLQYNLSTSSKPIGLSVSGLAAGTHHAVCCVVFSGCHFMRWIPEKSVVYALGCEFHFKVESPQFLWARNRIYVGLVLSL